MGEDRRIVHPMMKALFLKPEPASLAGLVTLGFAMASLAPLSAVEVNYEKEIKPLLKERCYSCHGSLKQKAGLRLDTVSAMKIGGESGSILDGDHSLLIERVTTQDPHDRMPPEGEGSLLTAEQVGKLKDWLGLGAPAPVSDAPEADPRSHWAYQNPKSSRQTLDALLTARLAEKKLKPQIEAAPEIWLRRVYLDLLGLPPSAEEVSAFTRDGPPTAATYARVVDRLLNSPQYGERWARHFMDIWRYCDWYGLGDQLRHSQKHLWHWRDWIVESLNSDKGYDQMIISMLAADELAPEDRDNLRATGFLARSYYLFNRTTWLDETIEHTSRAFFGVTMQCVKCHDHKYDPIEQTDYYRMRAIFEPLHVRLDPWRGETDLEKNGLPRVYDLHLDRPTYRHVRGDEKNEDKSKALIPGIPQVLEFAAFQPSKVTLPSSAVKPFLLPFVLEDQLHAADLLFETAQKSGKAADLRVASLRIAWIQAVYAAELSKKDKTIARAAAMAEARYHLAKAESDLAEAKAAPQAKDATKQVEAAQKKLMEARKKVATPGETYTPLEVTRKAQEGPEEKNQAEVQSYPESSTGRRLAFAKWVADSRNPLTARVLVNHVWARHFGTPIVADVGDFGRRAGVPLHQDILDTLAVDFMNRGWSLKQLHRTMVLSNLYRQSSSIAGADPQTLAADPDNSFYWRMNPRRMESQVVRDSLLQIGGKLDLALGGPSLDPAKFESGPRRSLYFIQNADTEHRFLAAFDNASVLECYRRNESIVPQQALALTNSQLSRQCADSLAARLDKLDTKSFIEQSFLHILARLPSESEARASAEGLKAMREQRILFLQALINHNDFVTLR